MKKFLRGVLLILLILVTAFVSGSAVYLYMKGVIVIDLSKLGPEPSQAAADNTMSVTAPPIPETDPVFPLPETEATAGTETAPGEPPALPEPEVTEALSTEVTEPEKAQSVPTEVKELTELAETADAATEPSVL